MNNVELIQKIAEESGVSSKDAGTVIQTFTQVVIKELQQGGKVMLNQFGSFDVSNRAGRMGRNPKTGETIEIKPSRAVRFRAGKNLKDSLNDK